MTKHRLVAAWTRAGLVLGGVFAIWLAVPGRSEAAVEGSACESEPTDQPIRYGDLIECAIDQIGDNDVFRFSGGSGETVKIQISRSSGGSACFQLFNPDGTLLDSFRCSNTSRDYLVEQSGTYTISIVENSIDETAEYTLALERIQPPSPASRPLRYNQIITDELNIVGDIDLFSFEGSTNDTASFQISRLGGGSACFQLFNPDGTLFDNFRCSNTSRNYALTQTGTHAIAVVENSIDETAQYALSLACVSGVCPDLDLPAVSGCIARRGAPFSERRVRLLQADEPTRTTLTDVRGCYEFDRVVAGKTFQVRIVSPRVPQ